MQQDLQVQEKNMTVKLYGSNTIPYARVMGLISEQTTNLGFRNDKNLTAEATARYRVARDDLASFANTQTGSFIKAIDDNNGVTDELAADEMAKKPNAIMTEEEFANAAKDKTLVRQGIYLVKNEDDVSFCCNYLFSNRINPFDPKKKTIYFTTGLLEVLTSVHLIISNLKVFNNGRYKYIFRRSRCEFVSINDISLSDETSTTELEEKKLFPPQQKQK